MHEINSKRDRGVVRNAAFSTIKVNNFKVLESLL